MEDFEGWQGGKGIVLDVSNDDNYPYKVEITEVPPANGSFRQGGKSQFAPEWLKLVEAKKDDPVSHPSHYTQYPVEVIELTRHMSFGRGNCVKYVARAGFKGGREKELEDLKKAAWYLQDEINQLEKKLEDAK